MTNQPPVHDSRRYTTVAIAIIIAAVVISAAVFTSSALYITVTKTITSTITTPAQTSSSTASGTTTCAGCPLNVTMSYEPCIRGYSGFQVTRQYPNPSTWTFELGPGSTGYLFYEYDVTKNLDFFLNELNSTWTIWQTYQNGSSLLAEISGSTVIHVQYNIPNEFPIIRSNQTYTLGVQLSLVNYTVGGNNIVNATWSLRGIIPGVYPVQSTDLEWHTFIVSTPTDGASSVTSETFPGMQDCGGSVNIA